MIVWVKVIKLGDFTLFQIFPISFAQTIKKLNNEKIIKLKLTISFSPPLSETITCHGYAYFSMLINLRLLLTQPLIYEMSTVITESMWTFHLISLHNYNKFYNIFCLSPSHSMVLLFKFLYLSFLPSCII